MTLVLYSSSAGSGKTYTLTREYLTLALRQPRGFGQILAVTFTKKATAEMKHRIVAQLAQLRTEPDSAMGRELQTALGLQAPQLAHRATEALQALLHNYADFAVSTIDSFFQRVLRAFAYELEVDLQFRVELDEVKVLHWLVEQLVADVVHDPPLRKWLEAFANERLQDGKAWDFRQDVEKLSKEIFHETFRDFETEMKAALEQADFIPAHLGRMRKVKADFEQAMKATATEARALLVQHELTPGDFTQGTRGVGRYFDKVLAGEYSPNNYTRAVAGGGNWYSKAAPADVKRRIDAVDAQLRPLLEKLVNDYDDGGPAYRTATAVMQHLYTLGILTRLRKYLQQYRETENALPIADVAPLLAGLVGGHEAPYIYERVGQRYQHFLIDEFQDTSGLQWANFRPLLENSLGSGHRNLLVGDVKQSIYRWRGGNAGLLLQGVADDLSEGQIERAALLNNWRSLPCIIAFNNDLFAAAPAHLRGELITHIEEADLPNYLKDDLKALTDVLELTYAEAKQEYPTQRTARTDPHAGGIYGQFVPTKVEGEADEPGDASDEDDERPEVPAGWKGRVLQQLVPRLQDLHARGYAWQDMAILTRNNKEGALVADFLTSAGLPVISNESLYLNSALGVRLLVQALRFLHQPYDRLAAATLLRTYAAYRPTAALPPVSYQLPADAPPAAYLRPWLPADFLDHLAAWVRLPLYEAGERLVTCFELTERTSEWVYVQQFQDELLRFGRTESADLGDFLTWWDEEGHKKKTIRVAGGQSAIQLLTIHKAKGLEYKVVVIPFANWELNHKANKQILWGRTTAAPFNEISRMPLAYKSELASTYYAPEYLQEMVYAYLDNLNLLYVATTRAVEQLLFFAPYGPKTGESLKHVGDLLYRYASQQPTWDAERQAFTLGAFPPPPHRSETVPTPAETSALTLHTYPTAPWRARFEVRSAATELFATGTAQPDPYRLVQRVLARLPRADRLAAALRERRFGGELTAAAEADLLHEWSARLAAPHLADWFGPAAQAQPNPEWLAGGYQHNPHRLVQTASGAVVVAFARPDDADQQQQKLVALQRALAKAGQPVPRACLYALATGEAVWL